jgi:hypothetical protein
MDLYNFMKMSRFIGFFPILISLYLLWTGVEFSLSILFVSLLLMYLIISERNSAVKWIVSISFLLRVLVAFLEHYGILTSYGWDDYFTIALQIKSNIVNGYPLFSNVNESIHGVAYAVICAYVYYLFGDMQIIMQILNCFLGALVADRVFRISFRLTNDEASSVLASAITAFFPSFIMFCALDMRDAVIFFLTAEALYRISGIFVDKSIKDTLILSIEAIGLYFLRTQYMILFTIIIILYLIIRSKYYKKLSQSLLLFFSVIIVVWLGYRHLERIGYFEVLFKVINADMAWRTAGGSAYLTGVNYQSWWDVVRWTPVRMIHFAFGPFPWTVNNLFMLLAALESAVLVLLTMAAFSQKARQIYNLNPRLYLFLLLFAVMGLFSSAVIDSNYGTAIRHKMNFIFVFFIFSARYIKSIQYKIV